MNEAHLTGALGPHVAAFLYVQSHHTVQKGMLALKRCIELCQAQGIPVLVDAAAEEELPRFVTSGADLGHLQWRQSHWRPHLRHCGWSA
ncbi:MAG: hypothetical protein R3E79_12100 [Caldilineaceae bacterium]